MFRASGLQRAKCVDMRLHCCRMSRLAMFECLSEILKGNCLPLETKIMHLQISDNSVECLNHWVIVFFPYIIRASWTTNCVYKTEFCTSR